MYLLNILSCNSTINNLQWLLVLAFYLGHHETMHHFELKAIQSSEYKNWKRSRSLYINLVKLVKHVRQGKQTLYTKKKVLLLNKDGTQLKRFYLLVYMLNTAASVTVPKLVMYTQAILCYEELWYVSMRAAYFSAEIFSCPYISLCRVSVMETIQYLGKLFVWEGNVLSTFTAQDVEQCVLSCPAYSRHRDIWNFKEKADVAQMTSYIMLFKAKGSPKTEYSSVQQSTVSPI